MPCIAFSARFPTLQRESIRLYLLPGLEDDLMPGGAADEATSFDAAEHHAADAISDGTAAAQSGAADDAAAAAQAADGGSGQAESAVVGTPAWRCS